MAAEGVGGSERCYGALAERERRGCKLRGDRNFTFTTNLVVKVKLVVWLVEHV